VPTIEAHIRGGTPGSFKDPRNEHAVTLLLSGRLGDLVPDDLARLTAANNRGAKGLQTLLSELDGIESDVRGAHVDASSHHNLSDDSKQFITDWNASLAASADELHSMRQTLASSRPMFDALNSLVRAVYDAARRRSRAGFDKLRPRVVADMSSLASKIQAGLAAPASDNRASRKLTDLVDNSQGLLGFVKKVNDRYPHGSLAAFKISPS
jgi:hypothetical protein